MLACLSFSMETPGINLLCKLLFCDSGPLPVRGKKGMLASSPFGERTFQDNVCFSFSSSK